MDGAPTARTNQAKQRIIIILITTKKARGQTSTKEDNHNIKLFLQTWNFPFITTESSHCTLSSSTVLANSLRFD